MPLDQDLLELLLDAADGLPQVTQKRMFGLPAVWAAGRIFALVYDGRIALKLTDESAGSELLAMEGAKRFAAGKKLGKKATRLSKWFVTPEAFHDDPHALRRWTARAHALALQAPLPRGRKRS